MLAALATLAAALRWLALGRYIDAIGMAESTAPLSGLCVGRQDPRFCSDRIVLRVGRHGDGGAHVHQKSDDRHSLLLPSIAAALIGGTSIAGGVGGLGRTLVGALTITVLRVGIAAGSQSVGVRAAYSRAAGAPTRALG